MQEHQLPVYIKLFPSDFQKNIVHPINRKARLERELEWPS
jgi:hypothetical protein